MQIVWLPQAQSNRLAQLDYIAQDNPLAAISQDEEIEWQVDVLADHPELGRTGRVDGTRELVITNTSFVVVYRINGSRIEILRVLHSSQQWPEVAE
jgi:toxin ParE1/3/4